MSNSPLAEGETVTLETDRPDIVAAALREAIYRYSRDVDDPRVGVDQEDLDHLAELIDAVEDGGRDE